MYVCVKVSCIFLRFFYWILEIFRQCGIFCFSYPLFSFVNYRRIWLFPWIVDTLTPSPLHTLVCIWFRDVQCFVFCILSTIVYIIVFFFSFSYYDLWLFAINSFSLEINSLLSSTFSWRRVMNVVFKEGMFAVTKKTFTLPKR